MKRVLVVLLVLVVLAVGAGAAFVLYRKHQARNVRGSSSVEFVTTTVVRKRPPKELRTIPWPTYGYDAARGRWAAAFRLRPPFRRIWTFRGRTLLEFPPAVAYGRLYLASNAGVFYAVSARTGKTAWKKPRHRCVAASPAVADGTVYETFLNAPPCNTTKKGLTGELVAYAAGTGEVRWSRTIGPSESSPLVANGLVYVGDWRGRIYAFAVKTGRLAWRFQTGGKIKGAVALAGKRLYAGSYDGKLYALYARTGKLIWSARSQPRLGSHGEFYSTPAAAYGRVYIGSTDGKVYSYGATSGKERWSHGTGAYVYASPAIWRGRVLVGSYSGDFTSFDAATGDVVWRFKANGPISGSATVLNGIVYFATLKRRTYALNAKTGGRIWSFPDGKYSPVVADSKRLYLVGYTRVYGMVPR